MRLLPLPSPPNPNMYVHQGQDAYNEAVYQHLLALKAVIELALKTAVPKS